MHTRVGMMVHGLRWSSALRLMGLVVLVLVLVSGCRSSATGGTSTGGITADATATSTSLPPTPTGAAATPTPLAGICRAADFPPPIRQGPALTGGDPGPFYGAPVTDFAFPSGTYYYSLGHVTGRQDWHLCSPGDPTAILMFMRQSIGASAWTLLPAQGPNPNPLSIAAQEPISSPTPGVTTPVYCRTLAITVGEFPGYPGEWSFSVFAPVDACR